MSHFNKYVHLERSTRAEVQNFIGRDTILQPKLDGTNSSVWVNDNGNIT